MADDEDWPGQNSLLGGLFGVFQSTIQEHVSTAGLWSALRTNAATLYYQSQGGGETPTEDELQETGRRILSEQGVNIQSVNTYRKLSNQWATAKQRLQSGDSAEQISAGDIFVPPWAQTAQPGVDARYRLRVGWQIEPADDDPYIKWASYEANSPLTSLDDLFEQASDLMTGDKYVQLLNGGDLPGIADYELEQI
jgi:hypothetical protein